MTDLPQSSPTSPSSPITDGSSVLASTTTVAFADPLTAAPAPSPVPSSDPFLGTHFPAARRPTGTPSSPAPGSARAPLSDLDRIAEALAPRALPPRPAHRYSDIPVLPTSRSTPRTHSHQPEVRDEQAYFGYVQHARQTHEQNRRDEYAAYLDSIAEDNRVKIVDLGRRAHQANRVGFTLREAEYRRQALELSEIVAEIEEQIGQVRSGELAPARIEVDPPDWSRINHDVGNLAPGGVRVGDRSALDGFAGRPPIDRTRRYNVVGGLRAPLAVHQVDLENAVPRDPHGQVSRLPDPREGDWFRLANDGGPAADPTRGLNCVDGVLALFDTYIHGRPRVSAPRTFDVYAHGNPDRPLGGETEGVHRIRLATGGDFQGLCPYLGDADPALAKPAMDQAVRNLTNHLLNTGHGSYAFILTDLEGGGSHSWSAVNHHGTVLFLDPQIGRLAEHTPMYRHYGFPAPTNIVSLEALVVDATGTPTPLPNHGPGNWSAEPPEGSPDDPTDAIRRAEREAFESLPPDRRSVLIRSIADSGVAAVRVSADLHSAVLALHDEHVRVVDEEYRVKSVESLGRKYLEESTFEDIGPEEYLSKVKDRVRFSVETPEIGYGATVTRVLDQLHRRGYRTTQTANFWADHGRHNGLNIWLTDPHGFKIEVQFPTPLSRAVGKETHRSYEIMRFGGSHGYDRVNAFLEILAINKARDIYGHRPSDLHLVDKLRTKRTTLAAWLGSEEETLRQYRDALSARNKSFDDDLRRHGLTRHDVPGIEEVGWLG